MQDPREATDSTNLSPVELSALVSLVLRSEQPELCFGRMTAHSPGCCLGYFVFFRLGRWVKAEPAAVLAALLDFGLRSTLLAADAALRLVTSLCDFLGIVCSPPFWWSATGSRVPYR